MRRELILILFRFLLTVAGITVRTAIQVGGSCRQGEKFVPVKNGLLDECIPCESFSFQDKIEHREINCKPCGRIDPSIYKVITRDCTRFNDVTWECVDGFYKQGHHCFACTNCALKGKGQLKACGKDHDSQCCSEKVCNVVTINTSQKQNDQERRNGPYQDITNGSDQEKRNGPYQDLTNGSDQEKTNGSDQEKTNGSDQEKTNGSDQEETNGSRDAAISVTVTMPLIWLGLLGTYFLLNFIVLE